MTALTTSELAEIKARHEAAQSGPWNWSGRKIDPVDGYVHIPQCSYLGPTAIMLADNYENYQVDCDFLSAARSDIPALLSHIAAIETERERMRELAAEQMRERCAATMDRAAGVFDSIVSDLKARGERVGKGTLVDLYMLYADDCRDRARIIRALPVDGEPR